MGNITLEQISMVITFLVGLVTGIGYLHKQTKKWISRTLKDEFEPVSKKIDNLQKRDVTKL